VSRLALSIVAFLITEPSLWAGTFLLDFNGVRAGSLSGNVNYTYVGTDNLVHSGSENNIYFAELSMTARGQAIGGGGFAFKSFCIDLVHGMISEFSVFETPLSTSPGKNGSPAPPPLNGWLGNKMGLLYDDYLNPQSTWRTSSTPTVTDAAAYQLALWRLTFGAGATLTSNIAALNTEANALYNDVMASNTITVSSWLQKTSDGSQINDGQGVLYPPTSFGRAPAPQVPVPGALVLLGSGGIFIGLFGTARRRFNSQKV
jgi:hypothetical protein